jgi:hypothetical protein
MSVRLPTRPHETTRLPPDGFSWHQISEDYSIIRSNKNQVLINYDTRMTGTINEQLRTFMDISLPVLLKMRNIPDKLLYSKTRHTSCLQKIISIKTCYHPLRHFLSSISLSKNLKIKIHRAVILTVPLYGCETWSLTSREERGLSVLRRIFGA